MSPALLALALSVAVQAAQQLRWVPNPRTTSGSWVADPAGHLRPATVATLDSMISALERETTAEVAVVVIDSLDGLDPSQAALVLHRRWGVGKRERDNGLLFLWSPALRRTYISVGYGLEGVVTDSRAGAILDEHVIPHFRAGDFDAGVVAGVRALGQAARGETYTGLPRVAAGRPGPEDEASRGLPVPAWLLGLAGVPLAWAAGAAFLRRRPRYCVRGHGRMRRLTEQEDDLHLQGAERLEERLNSVDYDVWVCGRCDDRRVIPYRRLWSGYRECPRCKRRTCKSTTRVLRHATRSSTGLQRVTRKCRNCAFTDSREEEIPRVSDSSSGGGSSGSSSGGSSFGGGSSGGGGAGRSY